MESGGLRVGSEKFGSRGLGSVELGSGGWSQESWGEGVGVRASGEVGSRSLELGGSWGRGCFG